MSAAPTRFAALPYVGPASFSMVMGLTGLALAWASAGLSMGGLAQGLAAALGVVAVALFVSLLGLSAWRWQRHPQAWRDDLQHPVRQGFVASLPIALMLLCSLAQALLPAWAALWQAPWLLACALQFGVTLWAVAQQLRRPGAWWAGLTPVFILPVVGNVVALLAGPSLGFGRLALVQFAFGALLWPGVVLGLFLRLRRQGGWPERLAPTAFITVAPPAVIGVGWAGYAPGSPWALLAWCVALVFVLASATVLVRMQRQGFGLPFWALSFPLAAWTALSFRLGWTGLGVLQLAAVSALVLGLALASWRAAREGRLWVSEATAALPPVRVVNAAAPR